MQQATHDNAAGVLTGELCFSRERIRAAGMAGVRAAVQQGMHDDTAAALTGELRCSRERLRAAAMAGGRAAFCSRRCYGEAAASRRRSFIAAGRTGVAAQTAGEKAGMVVAAVLLCNARRRSRHCDAMLAGDRRCKTGGERRRRAHQCCYAALTRRCSCCKMDGDATCMRAPVLPATMPTSSMLMGLRCNAPSAASRRCYDGFWRHCYCSSAGDDTTSATYQHDGGRHRSCGAPSCCQPCSKRDRRGAAMVLAGTTTAVRGDGREACCE